MCNNKKQERLREILIDMNSVLVAFSGGVDSTFLLKFSLEVLGQENVLAVTASSETYPAEEWQQAKKLAESLGVKHVSILTQELADTRFTQNPPDRCYYCKSELFQKLVKMASENGFAYVADGANADDLTDFRPGMKAGKELGVRSPLQEAGLTKDEIRTWAKDMGLPNWNKPSMPCLSSRFPYGHTITTNKLRQVEKAEKFINSLGFTPFRVRHHGETARIEVTADEIARIVSSPVREQVIEKLKTLGFNYITVDLVGFRSGSLNEVLSEEIVHG